jgi:hypothetical protein
MERREREQKREAEQKKQKKQKRKKKLLASVALCTVLVQNKWYPFLFVHRKSLHGLEYSVRCHF